MYLNGKGGIVTSDPPRDQPETTEPVTMNIADNIIYSQAAELIYSNNFKTRYIDYLFTTCKGTARTFLRKYNDQEAWHVDMAQFCVDRLPSICTTEPELVASATWQNNYADGLERLRARLFTIYHNYTTDRYRKYKTIRKYETQGDHLMLSDTKPSTTNLMRAITYRSVWGRYTDNLEATDKLIAFYLLDGAITMAALEELTGLKKSQIYLRLQRIRKEIDGLVDDRP